MGFKHENRKCMINRIKCRDFPRVFATTKCFHGVTEHSFFLKMRISTDIEGYNDYDGITLW